MSRRLDNLVREAARECPERTAIRDARQALTYAELDAMSERLAHALRARGVQAGDRVALWAEKSCQGVALMQAALRLGAAYVPIDLAMPAARVEKILADCSVRLLATPPALAQSLGQAWPTFSFEAYAELVTPGEPLPEPAAEHELAYVLYTSGSTGTPKGVCLSHQNALSFVHWALRAVGADQHDVFANHASFAFDLSVFDLYVAFAARATVCLVPEHVATSAAKLVSFMVERDISIWYSVPSALTLMLDHGALARSGAAPRVVIFAGESFPLPQLRALRQLWPNARFFNFYGPTETNVCTSYEVSTIAAERQVPVPIGKAASGDRVWAVTEEGRVAEPGECGELLVDGPSVMLGYWGHPPQQGPYRTGDLCLLSHEGDYEFVGRRDELVKVRGYRIELGEIEAVLAAHQNVRELAVLPQGEGSARKLVAFVAPRSQLAPTLIQLKSFAAGSLPSYMLIDRLELVEALPRTANGKIDRAALRARLEA